MYLIHITTKKDIEKILKNGEIRSHNLQHPSSKVDNNFVYFSCTDDLMRPIDGEVVIYLDPKILLNNKFYTSNTMTEIPDYLGEWKDGSGKITYKRKYPKDYKYYKKTLSAMIKASQHEKRFWEYAQIAVPERVSLDFMIKITYKSK